MGKRHSILTAALALAGAVAMVFLPTLVNAKPITAIITFTPATMRISSSLKGYCWTSSIAANRKDAYRCMAGNTILDPCFALSAKTVACPTDVAANEGLVMKLTKPLPQNDNGNSGGLPFQMLLTGGSICNVATGTRNPDYPYFCSGAGPGWVCSTPHMYLTGAYNVRCGQMLSEMKVTGTKSVHVVAFWR